MVATQPSLSLAPTGTDLPDPTPTITALRDLVSSTHLNIDPTTIQIHASALFARLKSLNRSSNVAARAAKQATGEVRTEMDAIHLGLQNLQYEKRHLEREIEKCRQFASIYQDVPVHSLDDFRVLAPEAARSDGVLNNEHQLMLNRLSFELAERQRLDLLKRELMLQKEELLKQSKAKLATMESVKTHIDALVKTAADTKKKVDELVLPMLPPPPTIAVLPPAEEDDMVTAATPTPASLSVPMET